MTDGPVMRLNQIEYSASDERLMFSALLAPAGSTGFSARSGKRPGAGLGASVSGTTVTVQPGAGVIYDPAYSASGPYLFALPALKTISLGDRPGSGQRRIDLTVARVYDEPGTSGRRELVIERVEGQPSSTPVRPALPPLSLEIAAAEVPASGAVSLTVSGVRTVAAGGVLPVATTAMRDALPSPYPGLTVYVEAADQLCSWSGSRWRTYAAVESGVFTVAAQWWNAVDLGWQTVGGLTTLSGRIQALTGSISADQTATLNGIPTPTRAWEGLLRNGNAGALSASMSTSRVITINGKITSYNSAWINLDGLTYPS
ncbi:hypothetical protein [Aeromicrobium piscarium]|uniref:Minor tail protein n=1 Tax=Aeromicrobium piscarium TaxID=2590901 RepID=A0A554SPE3_9ACTN|nr:hypothetical protein [Aeromicrobium piscarium]TSD68139.1 hypothetical protein FNM00_00645 [Aeromicrobium piscarium]